MTDFFSLSALQKTLYVGVLGLVIIAISFLMEYYKKTIRKGNAKPTELWVIGAILSSISSFALIKTGMFHPMLAIIGATVYVDYIVLGVAVFIAQLQADMRIIKKLVRAYSITLMKNAGISESDANGLLDSVTKTDSEKA